MRRGGRLRLSVIYTPLWVEGMVAGKGWIALALTTFATWRPLRVLLGAYLFGGVTMLQFHLQGQGSDPSQFLTMLPHLATIVVLVLISRNPTGSASTCRPRSANRSTRAPDAPFFRPPFPFRNFSMSRHDPMISQELLIKLAAVAPRPPPRRPARRKRPPPPAGTWPAAPPGQSPSCLKIAFAYVGPVGDGGWTFAHDNAPQGGGEEFGDKVVTSFVEKVPEGADAERVIRDMAGQGNKLIFGTTFGYMEPMLKVAADNFPTSSSSTPPATRPRDNMRTYDSRTYEGAYMAGVIAGG